MTLAHLDGVCLTDGGMETTLIFRHGLDLPHFAAVTLLAGERAREALASYYVAYLAVINCAHPTHFANVVAASAPRLSVSAGVAGPTTVTSQRSPKPWSGIDGGNPRGSDE